jgi:hypothetical protein
MNRAKGTSRAGGLNSNAGLQESGTGLAESAETPEELFARCDAKSRVADRETYERVLSLIAGVLTFPDHLFEPEPVLDSTAGDSDDVKLQRIIRQAARYRDLVQLLKQYPGQKQRWLLLALWLKQEGICGPMDFLPAQVYENLTHEKRAELRISITDVQHYYRVEAWKPYFDGLLQDRRTKSAMSIDLDRDLERSGYVADAVDAARKKRSSIPAVCEWLAPRLCIDATTLRNAHSRVSRKISSQNS